MSKAIVFTGVNQVEVQEISVPQPGTGEVLIAASYTGVSPGTELRTLAGKQPGADFPFIPGYSLAGHVIGVGEGVDLAVGAAVFCKGTQKAGVARMWGGHIAQAVVGAGDAFSIPAGVDMVEASLAHMAAIAYHGTRLSRPAPDSRVAVIGLGTIGMLSARLHAMMGAKVAAADLEPARVKLAKAAGIEAVAGIAELKNVFPEGVDVIIDATGAPPVLPNALELAAELPWDDAARTGPRYVVQGSYPNGFSVPYHAAFMKEVSFWLPRDCQPRDIRAVLDLMAGGALRVRDMIAVREPAQAPETYAALQKRDPGLLTAAFKWA
jgi:3-hydroxyethyl bacteriochlorophyllide a dehydrogenase